MIYLLFTIFKLVLPRFVVLEMIRDFAAEEESEKGNGTDDAETAVTTNIQERSSRTSTQFHKMTKLYCLNISIYFSTLKQIYN